MFPIILAAHLPKCGQSVHRGASERHLDQLVKVYSLEMVRKSFSAIEAPVVDEHVGSNIRQVLDCQDMGHSSREHG